MALHIPMSRAEVWTGVLTCDAAVQAAFSERPDVLAQLEDPHHVPTPDQIPAGASRVQIRPVSMRDRIIAASVAERHEEGPRRAIASREALARLALVWISDLPEMRPGPDGYPLEALYGSDTYAQIVVEVAARGLALGQLPKERTSPSASPSEPVRPGVGTASPTTATAATGAAPQSGG